MSCKPITAFPMRTNMLFDYEPGTYLRIFTNCGKVFEGYVFRSVRETKKSVHLEVMDSVMLVEDGGRRNFGHQRFEREELMKVEVVASAADYKNRFPHYPKPKTEHVFHTLTIKTEREMRKLIHLLKQTKEVALNLYGVFVGRTGHVGWICLFLEDTLVCIDAITLADDMSNFWSVLSDNLFENESILKVVYNSRPVADFLFHKHCIRINNVFDIQVAEFSNWCRGQSRGVLTHNKKSLQYKKLSECLEHFLKDEMIPEELQLLKEFQERDFSLINPLMERPPTDSRTCKSVAIDMKYLLRLKKILEDLLMLNFKICVSTQMHEMVEGNNAVMEENLKMPLTIPVKVVDYILCPPGNYIDITVPREMNSNSNGSLSDDVSK